MAAGTNALLNVCDGGTVCCGFKPNAADPHRKLLRSESDSKQAHIHVATGSHGYRLACMWLQARVATGSRACGYRLACVRLQVRLYMGLQALFDVAALETEDGH